MKPKSLDELIDKAIGKSPEYELPGNFADQVLRKIAERQAASDRQVYWMQFGAVAGFIVLSVICLAIFVDLKSLASLVDITGWAVILGVLIVIFQVLDHRLVKGKTHRKTAY